MKLGLRRGATRLLSMALALVLVLSQPALVFAEDGVGSSTTGTGSYVLTLQGTRGQGEIVVPVSPDEIGVVRVKLEVSGADVNLEKPKLVFKNPAPRLIRLQVADFDSPIGRKQSIDGQGNLVMVFDALKGGDKLNFNLRASFVTDGFVPQDKSFEIAADLQTAGGEKLKESNTFTITSKIADPSFDKQLADSSSSSFGAGHAEDGAIATPAPVEYKLFTQCARFGTLEGRNIQEFVFVDELPTYIDKNNKVRRAQLAPESAGAWTVSEDGTRATRVIKNDFFTTYFENYSPGDTPNIFLLFPDAKLDQPITNKATVTMKPYQRQDGEQDFILNSEVTKKISGTQVHPVNVYVNKRATLATIEDVPEAKTRPQLWEIYANTSDPRSLNNVVLTETPAPELYIDSLKQSDSDSNNFFRNILRIEGVKADGSVEEAQIQRRFSDIKIVNADKYSSLKIIMRPDFIMEGKGFNYYYLNILTKFRDPSTVSEASNPQGFKNEIKVEGRAAYGSGEAKQIATAKFVLKSFAAEYCLGVRKDFDSQNTKLTPGQQVSYIVTARNTVPTNGKITGRKLVVVLPDAMALGPSSFFEGHPVTSDAAGFRGLRYEQVENYNNSGKRAVIIDLPDLRASNMNANVFGDDNDIRIRLQANTFLDLTPVVVPTYYTFDGIGNASFVPWHSFGGFTGEEANDIYGVTGGASPKLGLGEVSWTSEPSAVLGAMTLVGAPGGPQTPYSYNITDSNKFTLAMKVGNYQEDEQTGLVMYNVLPHPGDTVIVPNQTGVRPERGSNSLAVLTGPATVPTGYKAYYLTQTPPADSREAINLSSWVEAPADWSSVKAVKVVAEPSTKLLRGQTAEVVLDVEGKNPATDPKFVDTFAYFTAELPNIVEANKALVTLPASYSIAKQWRSANGTVVNENTPDGITLPEKLEVDVMATPEGSSRAKLIKTVELSAANNWALDLNDLPAFEGAQKLSYSFTEHEVAGWRAEQAQEINGVFTFINTYVSPTINIPVSKLWDDRGQNPAHPELDVELLANGQPVAGVAAVKLNEGNNFRATFENQPVVDASGELITYSVRETNKPAFFADKVTGNAQEGFTIINTYQAPKTYTITKTWHAPNGKVLVVNNLPNGISLPEHVEVQIFKQVGTGLKELVQTVELNAQNGWQVQVENLITYTGEDDVAYSFEELAPQGWIAAEPILNGEVVSLNNTFVVPTQDISIKKQWVDTKDLADHPDIAVRVEDSTAVDKDAGQNISLSAKDGFATTLASMPLVNGEGLLIEYVVHELNVPEGYRVEVTGNTKEGFVVTNTLEEKPQALQDFDTPGQKSYHVSPKTADELPLLALGLMLMASLGVAAIFVAHHRR